MNKEIEQSGLGQRFMISATAKNKLSHFIGKKVRYKDVRKTDPAFVRSHGTVILDSVWEIRETQVDFGGNLRLRGYCEGDNFGCAINPKDIVIEKES